MNKPSLSTRNSRRVTLGLVLLGALMLPATATTAQARSCYTAEIPGTIVLPDGSDHAPGILRLCTDQAISPVSILHSSFVRGRPVGMFLSVPRVIEHRVEAGTAQSVFERGAGDELNLVGFIVGARGKTTLYEMVRAEGTRTAEDVASFDIVDRDGVVLLVASIR